MNTIWKLLAMMAVTAAAIITAVYAIDRFGRRRDDNRHIALLKKDSAGAANDDSDIADYRNDDDFDLPDEKSAHINERGLSSHNSIRLAMERNRRRQFEERMRAAVKDTTPQNENETFSFEIPAENDE